MEQHPVPQNVIDVEFKLFGSFTLRQFSKILFGCLGALGLYLTPIPDLIKLPLMAASVILGFGMAIVPNLGIWLMGYLKAIFISPRYVWVRETRTPELLKANVKEKPEDNQTVAKSSANKKVDISEIDLGQLFPTQAKLNESQAEGDTNNIPDPDKSNFLRVYQEVFDDKSQHQEVSKYFNEFDKAKSQNQPNNSAQTQAQQESTESLAQKIQRLKMQLSLLPKDSQYKLNEEKILNEINELYSQMKVNNSQPLADIKSNNVTPIKNATETGPVPGKIIAGIVVDKADKAIPGVVITFKNLTTNQAYSVQTLPSGKFSTENQIPYGEYEITLSNQTYKFHTYKISVGDQQLPLYKFRSR